MAFLYVSPDGDNSDGTTWAKAYTAVQTGINNVATGGGHSIVVAPGSYDEQLTQPAYAGASGNLNILYADTYEIIVDGDTATHGKGVGRVHIQLYDAQNELSDDGLISSSACGPWDYWIIQCLTGVGIGNEVIEMAGANLDYFGIFDCELSRFEHDWSVAPTVNMYINNAGGQLDIQRSLIHNGSTDPAANGYGCLQIKTLTPGVQSGVNINIEDSFLWGPSGGRNYPICAIMSTPMDVNCERSTFIAKSNDSSQVSAIWGANATIDASDCFVMARGYWQYLGTDGTYSNNFWQGIDSVLAFPASGWTELDDDIMRMYPQIAWSPSRSVGSGGPSSGVDIRGNTRAGGVGAEQFILGQTPQAPKADFGIQGISAGGGGGGILQHPGYDGGIK